MRSLRIRTRPDEINEGMKAPHAPQVTVSFLIIIIKYPRFDFCCFHILQRSRKEGQSTSAFTASVTAINIENTDQSCRLQCVKKIGRQVGFPLQQPYLLPNRTAEIYPLCIVTGQKNETTNYLRHAAFLAQILCFPCFKVVLLQKVQVPYVAQSHSSRAS